jgi:hypothetical protein
MKHCLYQHVMGVCQLGIFVGVVAFSGGPDAGAIQGGIIVAAIFAATIIILQDLPRGITRWSVAALYALAFATVCCFAWDAPDDTELPTRVIFCVLEGIFGCVLVACGVVAVKWMARLFVELGNSAIGKTRGVKTTEKMTKGDKPWCLDTR